VLLYFITVFTEYKTHFSTVDMQTLFASGVVRNFPDWLQAETTIVFIEFCVLDDSRIQSADYLLLISKPQDVSFRIDALWSKIMCNAICDFPTGQQNER
jgi:hypothetical protein